MIVSIFERDVGSGRIAAVQSHHFCVIQRSICDAAVSIVPSIVIMKVESFHALPQGFQHAFRIPSRHMQVPHVDQTAGLRKAFQQLQKSFLVKEGYARFLDIQVFNQQANAVLAGHVQQFPDGVHTHFPRLRPLIRLNHPLMGMKHHMRTVQRPGHLKRIAVRRQKMLVLLRPSGRSRLHADKRAVRSAGPVPKPLRRFFHVSQIGRIVRVQKQLHARAGFIRRPLEERRVIQSPLQSYHKVARIYHCVHSVSIRIIAIALPEENASAFESCA